MGRRIRQWIGYLIMLVGLGFLCGPFVIGAMDSKVQQDVVETINRQMQENQHITQPTSSPLEQSASVSELLLPNSEEPNEDVLSTSSETEIPPSSIEPEENVGSLSISNYAYDMSLNDAFYQAAVAYNQSLLDNGQDTMRTQGVIENFSISALDYGYTEEVVGIIRIPRIDLELGLYMGAGGTNMAKGGAIFGMTSLPLGLGDENVCVAGHRGWNGTTMFREIQKVQMNDPIYISTPWNTLTYRVTQIQIVEPDDNTWCQIERGKTKISIMTCHPYAVNTHRYIVMAELTQEVMPSEEEIFRINEQTYDPNPRQVELVDLSGNKTVVDIEPTSIEPDGSEYQDAIWSNMIIMAEDKMRPVAVVASVLVLLIGLYLTVATIRDFFVRRKEQQ